MLLVAISEQLLAAALRALVSSKSRKATNTAVSSPPGERRSGWFALAMHLLL